MLRHVVRLAVATLAVAAAGGVVLSPAAASTCGSASGVSVVVDFHQLGGGTPTYCDTSGAGKTAAEQFQDAGHTLTYVQGEPFVCQVDGAPDTQCARTPPANAYWSLWWSDGKSGEWTYSSSGVSSLKVPAGGYVALSWQGQTSQAEPRVTPRAHGSATPSSGPTASTSSSPHPTHGPSAGPSSSTPSSGTSSPVSPTSLATVTPGKGGTPGKHGRHDQQKPSHDASAPDQTGQPSDSADAAGPAEAVDDGSAGGSGSGGLAGWVPPVVILLLFAGAGGVVLVRRRGRGA